jgi:hypothetical protein
MGVLLGTQAVVGRACYGLLTRACACARLQPPVFLGQRDVYLRTRTSSCSARDARAAARACLRLRHRPVSRASAAGVTWTCQTSKAPWAARASHTSVIDAAGAIYVIGGQGANLNSNTYYRDVWASTDGGLDRTRAGGWSGIPGGYLGGIKGLR